MEISKQRYVRSFPFSTDYVEREGGGGYFGLNFRIVQPQQISDVHSALFFFREIDVNRVDGLLSTLDGLGTSINSLSNAT